MIDIKNYSTSLNGNIYNISAATREVDSELILFLHGLGCGKSSFLPIFNDDRFKDFSLLAPDGVGFGDSEKSMDFSYTIEDQATVIANVLENLSFKRLHIVAHSYGNAVALLLPSPILEKVATFVNSEGNLIVEDCGIVSRQIGSYEYLEFERVHFPKMAQENPAGPGYFEFEKMLPYAFWKCAQSLVAWSDSGELFQKFKSLDCHKEYFYGDQNRDMPILSKLGGIPLVEIQNSGHFMSADNPKQFYTEVYRVVSLE